MVWLVAMVWRDRGSEWIRLWQDDSNVFLDLIRPIGKSWLAVLWAVDQID